MSAIASFWLIPKNDIHYILKKAKPITQKKRVWCVFVKQQYLDSFQETLNDVGKELLAFSWSGWAFNELDLFLEQLGITLFPDENDISKTLNSERGPSHYIYGASEALSLSEKLKMLQMTESKIKQLLEREYDEDYVFQNTQAVAEALKAIIFWLDQVDNDSIGLFIIG